MAGILDWLGNATGYTQHMDNNQLLKNALTDNRINEEQYKKMGGYDVAKNMPNFMLNKTLPVGLASTGYQGAKKVAGWLNPDDPNAKYGNIDALSSIGLNMQGAQGLTPSNEQTYESIIGQYKPVGAMYPGGEHELSGINNINTDAGEKTMPGATLTDWASPFGNVPGEKIQEQVTEETAPIRTDFGRIDPLTTNQKPGFFEGIGQKLGMTQVTDADRTANEQFMQDQGIGVDEQTGRMTTGDFAGKIAPGKSGWGSANFDEMRGKWVDKYGDMAFTTKKMKEKRDRLVKEEAAYQAKIQQQAAAEAQRQEALRDAGAYSSQVQMDPGGGGTWHGQTAAKEAAGEQVAGPGFGKGAYFYQGGRVGYNQGGRVGILSVF